MQISFNSSTSFTDGCGCDVSGLQTIDNKVSGESRKHLNKLKIPNLQEGHFLIGYLSERGSGIIKHSLVSLGRRWSKLNFTYPSLSLTQTVPLRSVYILQLENAPSSFLEVITQNTPPTAFHFYYPHFRND